MSIRQKTPIAIFLLAIAFIFSLARPQSNSKSDLFEHNKIAFRAVCAGCMLTALKPSSSAETLTGRAELEISPASYRVACVSDFLYGVSADLKLIQAASVPRFISQRVLRT